MKYDHFAKDCPNDTEKEQVEQIQQMLNLDRGETALKVLVADTYNDLHMKNSDETIDHLNF